MRREAIHRSVLLAGRTTRYHTWPMIHKPSVAEHCWRVATLYVEVFGLPRAEVLYYCLHHDSGEQLAGDIPFLAKDVVPGLREFHGEAEEEGLRRLGVTLPELTEDERIKVKICDLLEMHEVGKLEVNMGNQCARCIASDTLALALEVAQKVGVYDAVKKWYDRS